MKFIEYGKDVYPTIILIHGAGMSYWAWEPIAKLLEDSYHVVLVVLDGHGGDLDTFKSIEESSRKIATYIHTYCDGSVFAISRYANRWTNCLKITF